MRSSRECIWQAYAKVCPWDTTDLVCKRFNGGRERSGGLGKERRQTDWSKGMKLERGDRERSVGRGTTREQIEGTQGTHGREKEREQILLFIAHGCCTWRPAGHVCKSHLKQ